MKKLCFAVIVLSFFGFAPIKSFYQSVLNTNGSTSAAEIITQKIKNSTGILSSTKKIESETFLITQKGSGGNSSLLNTAFLLRYDPENHKIMAGSVLLPQNESNDKVEFNSLKDKVKKDYNVTIDHFLQIDQEGMAHIIDLIDPQGILLTPVSAVNEKADSAQRLHGGEIVTMMNKGNLEEIKAIFSALESDIKSKQSAEKLISLAPSLIQEAVKSIKTDMGNAELLAIGFSAINESVTGVEALRIQNENPLTVNSIKQSEMN